MAERSAKQLGLSKADLPNSIIEVIATLNKGGFDAYIVGGGVRDTLLGLNPKDFDAVTDARPHEVKDLFGKRCRIIGRRFQLAHVYSGRDMIEVATFRAPPNGDAHTTSDGMIVRDNVWGDIEQDFARRDFSINAMYYQPIKGIVHDFCDALDDIKNKTLRLLGNAPVRVEEDPVRLLRALRFKAKLGFEFDTALSDQFHDDNWSLLDQVSPHRLYDESQKMFTGGYLVPLLPLLFEYGAIRHLFIYPPEKPTALVNQVAINTDRRIGQGKSINPAFFYAALLWDNYLYQLAMFKKKNMPFHDAQMQAASKVIDRQRIKTAIPKFAEQFIRDIWLMQPKLANPRVKQIPQLADQARFRAAFDFLMLRELCDDASNPLSESTNDMGDWWLNYQTLSEKQKQQAIDEFASDSRRGPSKSSRNRNRNRNRNEEQPTSENNKSSTTSETGSNHLNSDKNKSKATKYNRSNGSPVSKSNSHYAAEKAQLEKLTLGSSTANKSSMQNQPSPLFTIDAEKLAKQVPKQIDAETEIQKAEATKPKTRPAKQPQTRQEDNIPRKQSSEVQATNQSADNTVTSSPKAALLPKVESIPAKRRRRQPSTVLTQSERAKADTTMDASDKETTAPVTESIEITESTNVNTQAKPTSKATLKSDSKVKNTHPESKAKTKNSSPIAAESSTNPSKAPATKALATKSPVNTKKVDHSINATSATGATGLPKAKVSSRAKKTVEKEADSVIPKSERVPAVRRRREPSSTLSVNERG